MLRVLMAALLVAGGCLGQLDPNPAEALHRAARLGSAAEVTRLLAAGTNVDARDALGSTPLLDAAWEGHLDVVQVLLAHGADANAKHLEAGTTPLEYAVLSGRTGIARELLRAGAHTDVRDRTGATLLHLAAERGNQPMVELLVDAHADIEAVDREDYTPLEGALLHNQTNLIGYLLRHGANASRIRTEDGRQPMDIACVRGLAAAIPELVASGASPVARDHFGQTPLDLALAYKNPNVVAALLKLGMTIKESQAAADGAMEAATMRGQTEIVRLLVENGYDVNRPTPTGSTFLNDAALKGQRKVAQLLMDHGARADVPDVSGALPLHNAAIGGDADMVEMLLNRGAEVDARERDTGATALMLAASLARVSAVRVLLKRGANPSLRDNSGHTALSRAREADSSEVVKLLERS